LGETTVRLYTGETSYKAVVGNVARDFPIVSAAPHLWIASNAEFILGDIELISSAAELLAKNVRGKNTAIILTAEAKSIALAYELAKKLGHTRFIVARKSAKSYMGERITQPVRSITTESAQELMLTKEEVGCLSSKRVCLLDDVVSTGGTFKALDTLVGKAGGVASCLAAIWKEGPWYEDERLAYLGVLPVFVDGQNPLFRSLTKSGGQVTHSRRRVSSY